MLALSDANSQMQAVPPAVVVEAESSPTGPTPVPAPVTNFRQQEPFDDDKSLWGCLEPVGPEQFKHSVTAAGYSLSLAMVEGVVERSTDGVVFKI
jgi:hypothetical protein